MILVGELSLWVALLDGDVVRDVSFAGGLAQGRRGSDRERRARPLRDVRVDRARVDRPVDRAAHARLLAQVRRVATSSANMPKVYVFTAFWSGQAGSMLFWALILALYVGARGLVASHEQPRARACRDGHARGRARCSSSRRRASRRIRSTRLDWMPADGRGMNPQLQNPGMAIHPPTLYLGYVATAIPFAFAIAALMTRRLDAEWLARPPLGAALVVLPHDRHHRSACGGRTSSSGGAATGRGIRSRTRRSCRG